MAANRPALLLLLLLAGCQFNLSGSDSAGPANAAPVSQPPSPASEQATAPISSEASAGGAGQSPTGFRDLPAWPGSELTNAWPAWRRNCEKIRVMKPESNLGQKLRPRDLAKACQAALAIDGKNARAIQSYFERHFTPVVIAGQGKFTGYFEPIYQGSRKQSEIFKYPLYRMPRQANISRAQIDQGKLKGTELVYLKNAVDIFVLQIQGSAIIKLAEGGQMRVGYAGSNGANYVAIGKPMADAGLIPREKLSLQTIIAWLKNHPGEAKKWMDLNPRYIFFREVKGKLEGPMGAMGVPLTAGHSLAIDTNFTPLGLPLWLSTTHPRTKKPLSRLVIAQDKGSAIKGPLRGDLYWGSGEEAGLNAGPMNETGKYYILRPVP